MYEELNRFKQINKTSIISPFFFLSPNKKVRTSMFADKTTQSSPETKYDIEVTAHNRPRNK